MSQPCPGRSLETPPNQAGRTTCKMPPSPQNRGLASQKHFSTPRRSSPQKTQAKPLLRRARKTCLADPLLKTPPAPLSTTKEANRVRRSCGPFLCPRFCLRPPIVLALLACWCTALNVTCSNFCEADQPGRAALNKKLIARCWHVLD